MPNKQTHNKLSIENALLNLYSGIEESTPWTTFLDHLIETLEGMGGAIIISTPTDLEPIFFNYFYYGQSQTQLGEEYASDHFSIDPFIGLPSNQVFTLHEFLGGDVSEESDWYKSFGRYMEAFYIIGFDILTESGLRGRLRVCRDKIGQDFGANSRKFLAKLVPHFMLAVSLYEKIHQLKREKLTYTNALDNMTVAAFLLSPSGNIVETNQYGQQFLSAKQCAYMHNGKLVFSDKNANNKLFATLSSIRSKKLSESHLVDLISVADVESERVIHFALKRLTKSGELVSSNTPVLAIFATDPHGPINITPGALEKLYEFTPAEARLSLELANSLDLIDAAKNLNISHNTARAHLRSIYSKTGITKQSELIRLVARAGAEFAEIIEK